MSIANIRTLFLVCILLVLPTFAEAKTYSVPDPNPIATITIPDDWETEVSDRGGLASTTEDETYSFTVEATDAASMEKDLVRAMASFLADGITINEATEKKADFNVGTLKGFIIFWDAKDEDGPTQVSITVLMIKDTKALLMTGWGTEAAQIANVKALTAIMESIKAVQ